MLAGCECYLTLRRGREVSGCQVYDFDNGGRCEFVLDYCVGRGGPKSR